MNLKHIYSKKIFLISLFFIPLYIYAQEDICTEYKSYISANMGLRTALGQGKEFVFSNEIPLSILKWQILPSLGFQLNIDANLIRRIHFSLGLHASIPMLSGKMTDEDYMNPNPKEKTHFSVHDSFLKKDFSFLYIIGVFCPPYIVNTKNLGKIVLTFEPLTGITISKKEWYAANGYTQYPPEKHPPFSVWSKYNPKHPYKGKGVQYKQQMYFPFIGFNIFAETDKNIDFSFGLRLSPFAAGKTTDLHLDESKKLIFEDIFESGGWSFSLNHSLIKRFNSSFGIIFTASFLIFSNYEGYTNIRNFNGSLIEKTETGTSGTALTELSTMFGIIFYLGKK